MSFLSLWLTSGLVILGLMIALWLLSLALKDSSIVDIFWGTGFVITFWVSTFLVSGNMTARAILLGVLVTLWGLRLSFHIYQRNHGQPKTSATPTGGGKQAQHGGGAVSSKSFYCRVFSCG